jgi:hypothetical protein
MVEDPGWLCVNKFYEESSSTKGSCMPAYIGSFRACHVPSRKHVASDSNHSVNEQDVCTARQAPVCSCVPAPKSVIVIVREQQ